LKKITAIKQEMEELISTIARNGT